MRTTSSPQQRRRRTLSHYPAPKTASKRSVPIKEPLTGEALLNELERLGEQPMSTILASCGYLAISKSGAAVYQYTRFCNAVLQAQGVKVSASAGRRRGAPRSYRVRFSSDRQVQISHGYFQEAGFKENHDIRIEVEQGRVILTQV